MNNIAEEAFALIKEGSTIGLGTGRAATAFVKALGARVQGGFKIRGAATSEATAELARSLGIPLVTLDEVDHLDATFDGADEVSPDLDLIKGLGGALVREKIVATSSDRLIILVGPGKEVHVLGEHAPLPIEVVPFGLPLVKRRLAAIDHPADLRMRDGKPFITDNGNYILDSRSMPLPDPHGLEREIKSIPGVVETGFFLGMAERVLIQDDDGNVRVRLKTDKR